MARKTKYIPKSNEKLNKNNYKELLLIEKGNEYEFLEDYITGKEKILCRHNTCGNEWKVAPYELIKRGSGCPKCAFKKDSKKSSIEGLENLLLEEYGYSPYTFLGEYVCNKTPIEVECNKCKSIFNVTPSNIKNNIRLNRKPICKKCNSERMKEKSLTNNEYINKLDKLFGEEYSYEILEDYINIKTKIKHRCKVCEHEFEVTPQNIIYAKTKNNNRYCPNCNGLVRDERSYAERLKDVNPNIIPLEDFKGRKVPIKHKCIKCNYEWITSPTNRLNGEGCPMCANKISQSKVEKEIINFLLENNIEFIQKDRKVLKGKELDIFIPKLKIAIEIDGLYWHNEDYKGKRYHLEKTNECLEQGIQLIHIFDDEWENKQIIVKSKILHIIQADKNPKIYARKCYIEEISSSDKNQFLNENHIQGEDKASIKLGLWYPMEDGDLLVSVMTFCKPRLALGQKNSNVYDYELSRFASNNEYIVIGAFGKLFNYFIKNYDFNKIITYADKRYSKGNVYFTNGFKLIRESDPNYFYFNRNTKKRYHRFKFRKQELEKLFPEYYDKNLTEFQIMDKTKIYKRVWDCGNYVFEYDK